MEHQGFAGGGELLTWIHLGSLLKHPGRLEEPNPNDFSGIDGYPIDQPERPHQPRPW